LNPLADRLAAELLHQGFFQLCCDLQASGRRHLFGVGVDRLGFGEVDDRGKGFAGFKDLIGKTLLARLQRGRHPGHAAADNDQVDGRLGEGATRRMGAHIFRRVTVSPPRRVLPFSHDVPHRARAGVDGEFKEGDALQIADHVHAGDVGLSALIEFGEFFHMPGGPLGVQPVRVALKQRRDHRKRSA